MGALTVEDAPGNLARIYGRGSAERWGWLHADLGGGDVLEVVAAAPRRRGPLALPPVPVVQLRAGGRDWPAQSLVAALRGTARLGLPDWEAHVRSGARRLRAHVVISPERAVVVDYTDPDGSTATCTNSERASAEITLEAYDGGWRTERHWTLEGTAHAEVGTRP